MQKLLNGLNEYCKGCHLKINEAKSKVIVFRKGGRLARSDNFFINNTKLENVNSYKFLGLGFTSKASWSSALSLLAEQASKAIFMVKKSSLFPQLPPYLQLYIFDKKILPILLYASEVWGSMDIAEIETIHYKFCKYVLGLPYHSVNYVALGELGRVPISILSIYRKIKYWFKIIKHTDYRFTSICYKHMFKLSESHIPCWATEVKQVLFSTGFGEIWIQQGANDEATFLSIFLQRMIDINKQTWKTSVTSMNRLSLYNMYKTQNEFEYYITHITSKYHRSLLTKFRCGVLDLEINKGRHHNIPREHRLCTYCNLGKVEDEFHFLLECPCYSELRLIYFPRHFYITPNLISFSEMMKTTNKSLLYKICIFLEKGLKYRAEIDSYFQ